MASSILTKSTAFPKCFLVKTILKRNNLWSSRVSFPVRQIKAGISQEASNIHDKAADTVKQGAAKAAETVKDKAVSAVQYVDQKIKDATVKLAEKVEDDARKKEVKFGEVKDEAKKIKDRVLGMAEESTESIKQNANTIKRNIKDN